MSDFNSVQMTEAALNQLQRKISEQGHGKGLRVSLKKMGCSGLAYDLSIVDEAPENETIFWQTAELFVCIPPKDAPFIVGSTIDFVREGFSAQFKFLNPHEKASCGCGESFTVE
jgi:iron-sulfur cluster assembly protein